MDFQGLVVRFSGGQGIYFSSKAFTPALKTNWTAIQ